MMGLPAVWVHLPFMRREQVRARSAADLTEAKAAAAKEKEVLTMLTNGIVGPINSPYNNNLVMVKKKDGSIRTCVDFRRGQGQGQGHG